MEKVLTTNNGQANWAKLSTFGLHSRKSHIGFNRYSGKHGAVYVVDQASGMKVLFQAGQKPRSERERFYSFVSGKRGRPAKFGPVQQKEPAKRGRKPLTAEQKAEREALKAELASLVFFNHPQQKRGPKPQTPEQKLVKAILNGAELKEPAKRGRMNEAQRIAAAKPGDVVKANGGGSWLILPQGIPTFMP